MWHIIPESFRTHWKDWEVRFLVLFGLLLQLLLIPTGTHRRDTQRAWIQVLVWVTYLTAESIPILTLGVISNWLSNLNDVSIERRYELFALWAPIVLVHLGGPDSITAYALEDNELWLRHFARVSVQIGWTCYVYFLALSSSPLSYLAIGIILIGILKNLERTLSLFHASKDEVRDSLISAPRSVLLYPRLSQYLSLRKEEGHMIRLHGVTETEASASLSVPKNRIIRKSQDRNAFIAFKLLEVFEVLFAGLNVNLKALENIRSLISEEVTSENAFKIIDIELNMMFETLFTKASIIYNTWGKISKVTTVVLSLGVLAGFCMVDKRVYKLKLDLSITFMLILGLLLSEIYSILKFYSSDRMHALLIERKSSFGYSLISYIHSHREFSWLGFTTKEYRWSNTLTQLNILGLAVRKTPTLFSFNEKIRKVYEKAVQYFCVSYEQLGDSLRMRIHTYLRDRVKEIEEEQHSNDTRMPWLPSYGAVKRLVEGNLADLIWSTPENNFSQSIVIWHIATEILYHKDWKSVINDGEVKRMCEISRTLSQYLIYLLSQKPAMLPIGAGDIYHAHSLIEARKFFEAESSRVHSDKSNNRVGIGLRKSYKHGLEDAFRCRRIAEKAANQNEEHISKGEDLPKDGEHKSQQELDLCRLCHMLLEVPYHPDVQPKLVEGEGTKSVLFHASHLALQLKSMSLPLQKQWEAIETVWLEALLYSAYHSTGDVHAKQLSYGGELLTHVWLLMAHFGISKQVKASTMQALKRLVQS